MTEKIRRLVSQQAGSLEIFKAAREEGLRTLKEAAIEKVFRGTTTTDRDGAGHRQMNDDGLRGKVFLVTGSGRGLGAALARAAAAEKARVVVQLPQRREGGRGPRRRGREGGRRGPRRAAPTSPSFEEARALVDADDRAAGAGSTCS